MKTINVTIKNFEEIVDNHGAVVLDFWAEWCGPCKTFSPFFEQMAEANPEICFGKVNVEAEQELAAAFQVRGIPTIMAFKNGELVHESSGLPRPEEFAKLMEELKRFH